MDEHEAADGRRAEAPMLSALARRRTFDEVELALSEEEAQREARRCLRCDLEFTTAQHEQDAVSVTVGATG